VTALVIPVTKHSKCDQAFTVAAAQFWNVLPSDVAYAAYASVDT